MAAPSHSSIRTHPERQPAAASFGNLLNLPNFLTLCRIASIPIFLTFLTRQRYAAALYVFAAAAVTDGLDGAVAKTATGLKVYLRENGPISGIRQILDRAGKGRGKVQLLLDLPDMHWEADLTLSGSYSISAAVFSAIRALPQVADVQES